MSLYKPDRFDYQMFPKWDFFFVSNTVDKLSKHLEDKLSKPRLQNLEAESTKCRSLVEKMLKLRLVFWG